MAQSPFLASPIENLVMTKDDSSGTPQDLPEDKVEYHRISPASGPADYRDIYFRDSPESGLVWIGLIRNGNVEELEPGYDFRIATP